MSIKNAFQFLFEEISPVGGKKEERANKEAGGSSCPSVTAPRGQDPSQEKKKKKASCPRVTFTPFLTVFFPLFYIAIFCATFFQPFFKKKKKTKKLPEMIGAENKRFGC